MNHIKLLSDLISIQSYSGEESTLRNYIKDWFSERKIKTISQDENLLVHLKGADSKKAFIINSHMDTVEAGYINGWKHNPFKATILDDKLIGLGASDMKAGLASSMLLAEKFANSRNNPTDIWFTFVVKEEMDGSGTKSFVNWFKENGYLSKYKDIAAIFTEPTSLKEIEHGHRGNIFIRAETRGDTGHGSRPREIKQHAVRNMIKFSDKLKKEVVRWAEEFSDDVFDSPTVGEMTSISAGSEDTPNKFPDSCRATFDIRTNPKFHKVALKKIANLAKGMNAKVSLVFPDAPAGYTHPSDKIIKVSREILPQSKLTVSQGAADLGFLTTHGIKAVILGPGEKEQCHKANEYCYPHQIPEAVNVYEKIINHWAE